MNYIRLTEDIKGLRDGRTLKKGQFGTVIAETEEGLKIVHFNWTGIVEVPTRLCRVLTDDDELRVAHVVHESGEVRYTLLEEQFCISLEEIYEEAAEYGDEEDFKVTFTFSKMTLAEAKALPEYQGP